MLVRTLKRLARVLLGDYGIYRVYVCEPPWLGANDAPSFEVGPLAPEELAQAGEELSELDWYFGPECHAYACRDGGALIAVAFFWHGERYRQRNFWPLRAGEAKLVQLLTIRAARGRGAATILVREATRAMFGQGFSKVFARVWHSNRASVSAFERAGFRRCADVVEVFPFRSDRSRRWVRRRPGN